MELDKGLKIALGAAEGLLQERQAISDAITLTQDLFPGAIQARLQAEQALSEIEAAAALGEVDERKLIHARKHLADSRTALDSVAARRSGLTARLNADHQRLTESRDSLEPLTRDHITRIEDEFRQEWNFTAAAHGQSMARRLALEAVVGQRLNLLDPIPSTESVNLGESAKPFEILQALEAAISEIEQLERLAARDRVRTPVPFDPDAIYEFKAEQRLNGRLYKCGDRVLGATLGATAAKFCIDRRCLVRVDLAGVAAG